MPDDSIKLFIKESNDVERKLSNELYSPFLLWQAIKGLLVIASGAALTTVIGIAITKLL